MTTEVPHITMTTKVPRELIQKKKCCFGYFGNNWKNANKVYRLDNTTVLNFLILLTILRCE